jgi:hypothetical protein
MCVFVFSTKIGPGEVSKIITEVASIIGVKIIRRTIPPTKSIILFANV